MAWTPRRERMDGESSACVPPRFEQGVGPAVIPPLFRQAFLPPRSRLRTALCRRPTQLAL
jgi:hypothetical protein